jgi:hypothetical protein
VANALYVAYKNAALGSGTFVDMDGDTIKISLVDSADYTVNLSTDNAYDDVDVGSAVVSEATLAGKTISGGAFDSTTDQTFSSVTGDVSELIVMWKDTGTPSTSTLVAYYDTFSSGMPVTPNGGNIQVTVNASGWFSL